MADYQDIQKQLAEKRQAYGQRIANYPQLESDVRSSLYGGDAATQNLQAIERAKIDELFRHDQEVATQYAQNPQLSTSPSGRVLDPYARETALSNRYRATAGELTSNRQQQQTRRDVIGDSLQNALNIAKLSLEAKRQELEDLKDARNFEYQILQDQLDREERAGRGSGGGGGGEDTPTQEMVAALKTDLLAALEENPSLDRRDFIWKWIHRREPFFKAEGINSDKLWAVRDHIPVKGSPNKTGVSTTNKTYGSRREALSGLPAKLASLAPDQSLTSKIRELISGRSNYPSGGYAATRNLFSPEKNEQSTFLDDLLINNLK